MSLWLNGYEILGSTIGNKYTDDYSSDTCYGKITLIHEHFHSTALCYPNLANSIIVTGGSGAWELGSFVEIIPSDTITDYFDIHWLFSSNASVTDEYQINLYKGTLGNEILICSVPVTRDTNQSGTITSRTMTEVLPSNTRISAKIASKTGGNDTINIKLSYHIY